MKIKFRALNHSYWLLIRVTKVICAVGLCIFFLFAEGKRNYLVYILFRLPLFSEGLSLLS